MKKLPVGSTIVEAYRFAFGHLGTIIGLIWLPMVLATLLNFLPQLGNYGADQSGTGTIESLAILVLTQLLYAMIYVAVTRQALGLRQGPAVIHFALGPPEFRMFGAILLFLMVGFGSILTFTLLLLAVAGVSAMPNGNVVTVALIGSLTVAGGCAIVYGLVRLGYLLAPVTVVENRVDLARGWALTRGNFWRILSVLLAIALPFVILESGALIAMMGKDVLAALPAVGSSDATVQQHMAMLEEVFRRHTPQILGITLIVAPFNIGLSVAASSFGYRALAPEPPREFRA